jgi:hypothetical protein
MAGFFRGRYDKSGFLAVYEGEYRAAEPLKNGMFVRVNQQGLVERIDAPSKIRLLVVGKGTEWDIPMAECKVLCEGNDGVYFVEQDWRLKKSDMLDEENVHIIRRNEYVRMRIPLRGDRIAYGFAGTDISWMEIGSEIYPN